MNHSSLRRLGAALVFSFVTFAFSPPVATAADTPAESLRHGSRASAADGTMVVYDKVHGVYLVPDRENTYWVGNRFYRYDNGVWLTANTLAAGWELTAQRLVPEPAQRRHGPILTTVTARLPSGRDAIYEPRLKVYKVAGRKGVFLFDGMYYRYDGGVWLESPKDEGPWVPASARTLPPPLRKAVPAPEAGQTVTLPSGETLVYDDDAKLFVVQGKPAMVLFEGMFYEKRDRTWVASAASASGFEEVAPVNVPAPVRMKFRKPADADKAKSGKNKGEKAAGGKGAGESARDRPAAGKHAKQHAAGDESQ